MPNRITDTPTYATVHTRLMNWRGSAKNFDCVDCGGTAEQWSLNNDAQNTVIGPSTRRNGVTYLSEYSYDINDYSPRCIECHATHDDRDSKYEGVKCVGPCDREAITDSPLGAVCGAHYMQQHKLGYSELKELQPKESRYVDELHRRCSTCDEVKPNDDFYKTSKGNGYRNECKECTGKRSKRNKAKRDAA